MSPNTYTEVSFTHSESLLTIVTRAQCLLSNPQITRKLIRLVRGGLLAHSIKHHFHWTVPDGSRRPALAGSLRSQWCWNKYQVLALVALDIFFYISPLSFCLITVSSKSHFLCIQHFSEQICPFLTQIAAPALQLIGLVQLFPSWPAGINV